MNKVDVLAGGVLCLVSKTDAAATSHAAGSYMQYSLIILAIDQAFQKACVSKRCFPLLYASYLY